MVSAIRTQTVRIPAGFYAVGDLCNLLSESHFEEVISSHRSSTEPGPVAHATTSGLRVVLMSTGSGDGWFSDDRGGAYAIDTGTIAVVPLSDPAPWQIIQAAARRLVTLCHFKAEVEVASTGTATYGEERFTIGELTITRP
jgi:hypothetical protein